MSSTETPIISVRNLTKKFKDFIAVDDISFQIERGEIFGFLGPNGAGKSTTIKMLTTLLESTSGEILINGFNPMRHALEARKSFGIIFQDPSLDSELTALENMRLHAVLYKMPRQNRETRIEELMTFVDLWERRNELLKNFSGGMKRRLEIARGLLHHPKILFLDEPTLGLDPQTRNHLWNYVRKINGEEGTTVFFTTHYMEEAERVAQRIAVIDHGKIVATGSPAALREQTETPSLEEAFLKLTGKTIRDEEVSGADRMRVMRRVWGGGR